MRPVRIFAFALVTAVMVLAGCGESTPTVLIDTPTQTITPRPIYLPTITKHHSTPLPTDTQSPADIISTLTATAQYLTQEVAATSAAEFPLDPICPRAGKISPDHQWLATYCSKMGHFAVINQDGSKYWKVPYKDIFSDPEDYPYNVGGVSALFWTPDSQFVYFAETNCCWGGAALAGYHGDLYRQNIQTGVWYKLIPGFNANYYSFSPTGRRMVYIREFADPINLIIYDLQTGSDTTIPFASFEEAAYIIWSPDGMKFAITASTGNDFEGNMRYSVLIIDPISGSQQILISDSDHPSYSKAWTDDNIIIIYVTNGDSTQKFEDDKYLYFDVEANQFVATPTFTP